VGGEEFVVVLPETELLGAVVVGNRLRLQIKEYPFETPKGLLFVTVSVGVGVNRVGDQKQLFYDTDQALYIAKHGGKDRVAVLPGNISDRPTFIEASQ
jgi:diguanylate cyclase (GGDEF)-like protein